MFPFSKWAFQVQGYLWGFIRALSRSYSSKKRVLCYVYVCLFCRWFLHEIILDKDRNNSETFSYIIIFVVVFNQILNLGKSIFFLS